VYGNDYFDTWYGKRSSDAYAAVLADVVAYGRPGPIADLGAGTGLLAELAWRWGLSVVAYEGSQYAVDAARSRCPGLPIFQHALEARLPMDDGSVDNVVLNQVIEHLTAGTAEAVLAEAHRVLRPRGRLFVYSPSRRNRYERDIDATHIRLLLPSELDGVLRRAAFEPVRGLNAGFWFLPRSRVGMHLGRMALRVLPQDPVSATANAVAEKR
jgi:SAM-dependent methyltransferase